MEYTGIQLFIFFFFKKKTSFKQVVASNCGKRIRSLKAFLLWDLLLLACMGLSSGWIKVVGLTLLLGGAGVRKNSPRLL